MSTPRNQRRNCRGFTIVHLCAIIVIVIVAIAYFAAVFTRTRIRSFQADTSHEIGTIAMACGNYFQDFHAYPGPLPEEAIHGYNKAIYGAPINADSGAPSPSLNTIHVSPTPVNEPQAHANLKLTDITSSQNLVLGLLGGLSLISPAPTTGPIAQFDVTLVNKGPIATNAKAMQRYPAYYDASKYELSSDGAGNLISTPPAKVCIGSFVVPEFLDHFANPRPIIYLRAIPGAIYACDIPIPPGKGAGDGSEYYSGEMTPYCPNFFTQSDSGDSSNKPLYPFATGVNSQEPGLNFFQYQLKPDKYTPRSKDTFILISAGFDGIFGTKDDISYSN